MLRPIENLFDQQDYPNLVVGLNAPDDAAVWKVDDQRGLVVTTDFFTPVVDDPLDYGRIAAANSLSDIYAMGGKPFLALNIAALPPDLDSEISSQIILGGAEVAKKAGVIIAGGHTVQDKEPKYGLVVVGFVELDKMFTKAGARAGDRLYLTKPLGFGTITTALKRQVAREEDVAEAVGWMTRLNRDACQAGLASGVGAATDITGYSFLGHALEVADASHVAFHINFDHIPVLQSALTYAAQYIFPGGAYDNRLYFQQYVKYERELGEDQQMLLFDPQTSGGLLLAVLGERCADFEAEMKRRDAPCWQIGEVTHGSGITIT